MDRLGADRHGERGNETHQARPETYPAVPLRRPQCLRDPRRRRCARGNANAAAPVVRGTTHRWPVRHRHQHPRGCPPARGPARLPQPGAVRWGRRLRGIQGVPGRARQPVERRNHVETEHLFGAHAHWLGAGHRPYGRQRSPGCGRGEGRGHHLLHRRNRRTVDRTNQRGCAS